MVDKKVTVKTSLEARSAALFVQLAGKFQSSTKIALGNKYSNCKSIMGMISLGILEGREVVISAEGGDEEQALKELCDFLESEKH